MLATFPPRRERRGRERAPHDVGHEADGRVVGLDEVAGHGVSRPLRAARVARGRGGAGGRARGRVATPAAAAAAAAAVPVGTRGTRRAGGGVGGARATRVARGLGRGVRGAMMATSHLRFLCNIGRGFGVQ